MKTLQLSLFACLVLLFPVTIFAQTWESLIVFQDSVNSVVVEDFDLLPNGDIAFCAMVIGDSFTYQDSVYRPDTDSSVYRCAVFGQLDAKTSELKWVKIFGNQYYYSIHSTIVTSETGQIFAVIGSDDALNLPSGMFDGVAFTLMQFSQSGEILRSYTPTVTSGIRPWRDTITTELLITSDHHLAFGLYSSNDFTTGGTQWLNPDTSYQAQPISYFLEFDTTFQYIRGTTTNDYLESVLVLSNRQVFAASFQELEIFDPQMTVTQTVPIQNLQILDMKTTHDGDILLFLSGNNIFSPLIISGDTIALQNSGQHHILMRTSPTLQSRWILPMYLPSISFGLFPEVYQTPEIALDRNGDILLTNYSTGGLIVGNRIFQPPSSNAQHYSAKVSSQTGQIDWLTFGGGYKVQTDTATNQIVMMGAWSQTMRFPDTILTTPFTVGASFFRNVVDDNFPRTPNIMSGLVFRDGPEDCSYDPGDTTVARQSVVVNDQFHFFTGADGRFVIEVDTGSFSVKLSDAFSGSYFQGTCPSLGHQVDFDTLGVTQSDLDFGLGEIKPFCPPAILSISTPLRRPCLPAVTSISVENNAGISLPAETLTVTLPDSVWILSANYPYTQVNHTLTFELPRIDAGETLTVILQDSVSCSPVALLGQSACITAEIDNLLPCVVLDPLWNEANLDIEAECLGGKAHIYIVSNNGIGDMTDSVSYEIYADTSLIESGKLWLASGDTLVFQIPTGTYQTYMQVQQVAGNPFTNSVSAALESCPAAQSFVPPVAGMFPPDEQKSYSIIDMVCDEYRVAYDPNDKTVWPSGIPPLGITKPETPLTFRIRFQNTGNDTAFKVVLVDTLSAQLDVRSFRPRSASHPYKFKLSATTPQVLTVVFDNILLPDSTTNEPQSHGAFFYQIYPIEGLPEGTQVENFADIYFDFNPPIRTDTTLTTYLTIPKTDLGILVSSCDPKGTNSAFPEAGEDETICINRSIALNAEEREFPGFWTSLTSGVTIIDPSSPTTEVEVSQSGDYSLIWSIIECGRLLSDTLTLTVLDLPAQPEIVLMGSNVLSTKEVYESYQWSFNGVEISQDSQLTVAGEGQYSVIGSRNGCESVESAPYNFVEEMREEIQVKFWQDASGVLMVEVTGPSGESVEGFLADMRGKTIASFDFELPQNGVQTESLGEVALPN
ncbi:MAG: hypothetical protein NWR72_21895, partial [Bacteroidia bacterium]|nr:hypothetical protein [Bacteroidia bacterium]